MKICVAVLLACVAFSAATQGLPTNVEFQLLNVMSCKNPLSARSIAQAANKNGVSFAIEILKRDTSCNLGTEFVKIPRKRGTIELFGTYKVIKAFNSRNWRPIFLITNEDLRGMDTI